MTVIMAIALMGCAIHSIQTSEASPLVASVASMHDAYVNADPALTSAEKAAYLQTSSNWRADMAAGDSIDVEKFSQSAESVMGRYDVYVRNDARFSVPDKAMYLRSTGILRKIIEVARK